MDILEKALGMLAIAYEFLCILFILVNITKEMNCKQKFVYLENIRINTLFWIFYIFLCAFLHYQICIIKSKIFTIDPKESKHNVYWKVFRVIRRCLIDIQMQMITCLKKVRMCLKRGDYWRYIFRNILAISNAFGMYSYLQNEFAKVRNDILYGNGNRIVI